MPARRLGRLDGMPPRDSNGRPRVWTLWGRWRWHSLKALHRLMPSPRFCG